MRTPSIVWDLIQNRQYEIAKGYFGGDRKEREAMALIVARCGIGMATSKLRQTNSSSPPFLSSTAAVANRRREYFEPAKITQLDELTHTPNCLQGFCAVLWIPRNFITAASPCQ